MPDGVIRIETEIDETGIIEGLERLATVAEDAMAALQASITDGGASVADAAAQMAAQTVDAAAQVLTAAAGQELGDAFAGGIAQGIDGAQGRLSASASAAAQAAQTAAEAGLSGSESLGVRFGEGLAQGISATTGFIQSAARQAAQAAVAAAGAALDIHSPSRVMAQVGQMFGQGFAQGIGGTAGEAGRAARELSSAAASALVGDAAAKISAAQLQLTGNVQVAAGGAAAAGGSQVTIEALHVHTQKLENGQDWEAAGRQLSEAFARSARYTGAARPV